MNVKEWGGCTGMGRGDNWREIDRRCDRTWKVGTIYMDYTYRDEGEMVILINKSVSYQPIVCSVEDILSGKYRPVASMYSDKMVPLGKIDLTRVIADAIVAADREAAWAD